MSTTERMPAVMTSAEVAEFLRVPEATVLHYATRSWLPGRQIGGQWRFWRGAIEEWLRARSGKELLVGQVGALEDDLDGLRELRDAVSDGRNRPDGEAE